MPTLLLLVKGGGELWLCFCIPTCLGSEERVLWGCEVAAGSLLCQAMARQPAELCFGDRQCSRQEAVGLPLCLQNESREVMPGSERFGGTKVGRASHLGEGNRN